MKRILNLSLLTILATLSVSCSMDEMLNSDIAQDGSQIKINLSGEISQVYQTRANDTGFCNGDEVGIYVVDYNGAEPGVLQDRDNRGDNVKHVFDEPNYKWNSAYDIYFKDSKTHVDIYGYYPFGTPTEVNNYIFEVQKNQSETTANGKLGGYEASDFLWGKATDIAPTERVIRLSFRHMMASARVTLEEGSGFGEGEWASLEKSVLLLNTKRESNIDLATGTVTAVGATPSTGTIPYYHNGDYRAIIVPQVVSAGVPLVSVTVGGVPYVLKKNNDFTYSPSKQHNFTIKVNKREQGGYEFALSSESITAWENDSISHDATAREYVVINVEEAGTLEQCIAAAKQNISKLRNLKVVGQINSRDFATMKFRMPRLSALNLKEVEIVACPEGNFEDGDREHWLANEDGEIPTFALNAKESLVSLVLPDKLRQISGGTGGRTGAFAECKNLSGSLVIPEGVVKIGGAAFAGCTSLTGSLTLPSTLKQIGETDHYDSHHDGAFIDCNFTCELKIPESVEIIGGGAFRNCSGFYGELRLPKNLKHLGYEAFCQCSGLTGSLEIPQTIINIPNNCFAYTYLGGALLLHDGIMTIGEGAFCGASLKGELRLPRDLEVISHRVFSYCDFSGELVLPKNLYTIGNYAFEGNWRLMGVLEIPENVISIGTGAFCNCSSLEGVIFPVGLENIRSGERGAFQDCFGIGRIVCKGSIPPYVQAGAFDGIPKDNFTLEVPESVVAQYQASVGWKDFKRISGYRNLVARPAVATAINTSATRDVILNADNEWIVENKPDWITLDKNSGVGKAEIKLTFAEMPRGSENREGEVVFKLVDEDYRTRIRVSQYDYEYAEDQVLTLQSATKGNGINVVFIGDGYNAKDISEGKLMSNITEAVEHFFNVEPFKTYRDYFTVYTAIPVSPESGVGGINTIVHNRFNTTSKGGVTLGGRNSDGSDYAEILNYACKAPTVSNENLNETLVVMIVNTVDYGGTCYMYDDGTAIAYCPLSDYGYPTDFRGGIQHEACGHGFGKLGDEYIYHNKFIDNCDCTCCGHVLELSMAKSLGWYENLSLTGRIHDVPWSHLIFHERYHQIVDIFEGGYMHTRGVFRSEQNSCMNNNIPYFSTISRETMVKRIMAIAGEEYSFEKFVENDKLEAGGTDSSETRSEYSPYVAAPIVQSMPPILLGNRPIINEN